MTFWHIDGPINASRRCLRATSSDRSATSASGGFASDPVLWAEASLGFAPDPVQAKILRSSAPRLMLCCTRQFGKSTITAVKALHYAMAHPGSLVLAAAPTARQSGEWLNKTREFLARLGVRGRSDGNNRLSCVLPNGSRLVGLPGVAQNVRGFSKASLVIIDEAAFVPEALYQALNPMLAVSAGSLWLISTPAAQIGFFYDEWSREQCSRVEAPAAQTPDSNSEPPVPVAWDRYQVTANQCPRIPSEFLAEQRVLLGDEVYRREYQCEFVAGGDQLIGRDLLDEALDAGLAPFNGGKALWR